MFDLEKEIAAWRGSLRHGQTFLSDDLDELEAHLRDHVDALASQGIPVEAAYGQALRRLGPYSDVEAEYRKMRQGRRKRKDHLGRDIGTEVFMLRNYLTIAWRNVRREKVYAGINLFGLAVAIACVLLVFLYVRHEFSFDSYHKKGDRIYRLLAYAGYGEKSWGNYVQGDPVHVMRTSDTEVVDAVKLNACGPDRISMEGAVYRDLTMICTDPSLFNIFSFDLVKGDPAALERPNTTIITRSLAERLFNGEDPIGKTIPIDFYNEERIFEVAGLMEDVPANTHFTFDLLLSFETLRSTNICLDCGQQMYALLKPGADLHDVADRALKHIREIDGKEYVDSLRLEPLKEVYFSEIFAQRQGDSRYIYILSTIALVMLLIACANYMNLATARSARRAREVGVRKALGAQRMQLVRQFMVEALLLVLLALPLALVLLAVALPLFNGLAETEVALAWTSLIPLTVGCAGVLVLVGLIGGSYPALYLSGFEPIQVLKGRFRGGFSAVALRRLLVVGQFAASMVLIAATVVVLRQIDFMQERELGFNAEQVVLVHITEPSLATEAATLRQEFLRNANVLSAAAGYGFPGQRSFSGRNYIHSPESENGPVIRFTAPNVDAAFIETMQVPLVAGRSLRDEPIDQRRIEVLLNETALRALGLDSPEAALGEQLGHFAVVGVVRDFHFESLHNGITPLMLEQNSWGYVGTVALRLKGGDIPGMLAELEQTWKRLAPGAPFEFTFLRDELNQLYEREQRAAKVFGLFAGLAILIACLGLFGLAAFTAEQRRKEIGIRKVLGASVTGIVALLSRDFVKLIVVAVALAAPVAYFLMQRWLEDFAYRISLQADVFLLSGVAALATALLTISYQAVKAARANPVESLRYE